MSTLPWFRAYTKMVDDEKLRLLAFEDRWHFMAILCLKGQGVLDNSDPLMMRKAAVKMGLDLRTLEEVARRLDEVGLIDKETMQPLKWDDLQQRSDVDSTAAERKRRQRQREREEAAAAGKQPENIQEKAPEKPQENLSRVTVTNVTRTDIDKEEEKEKEEKTKKKRVTAPTFSVPGWINKTHWDAWHSCAKRKNASDAQKQMAVDKLDSWRQQGIDHAAALENAAIAGWQGLFKPDVPAAAMTPGRRSNAQPHKYAAAAAAIFDFDDNPAPSGPSEVIDV